MPQSNLNNDQPLRTWRKRDVAWAPYIRLVGIVKESLFYRMLDLPPITEAMKETAAKIKHLGYEEDILEKSIIPMSDEAFRKRFIVLSTMGATLESIKQLMTPSLDNFQPYEIEQMIKCYWDFNNPKNNPMQIIEFLDYYRLFDPEMVKIVLRAASHIDKDLLLLKVGIGDSVKDADAQLKNIMRGVFKNLAKLEDPNDSIHFERYARILLQVMEESPPDQMANLFPELKDVKFDAPPGSKENESDGSRDAQIKVMDIPEVQEESEPSEDKPEKIEFNPDGTPKKPIVSNNEYDTGTDVVQGVW